MRDYGVYWCLWYIRHHEYCTHHRTLKFILWPDIREMKQDGTLGKMLPVRPLRVNGFLQRYQTYVWYQDDISLVEHSLVCPFQFGTTGRKKLKYPNIIDTKHWKELGKEGQKKVINTSNTKEVVPLEIWYYQCLYCWIFIFYVFLMKKRTNLHIYCSILYSTPQTTTKITPEYSNSLNIHFHINFLSSATHGYKA